ncbi:DUF11 domain-containing protein [Comamonas sp. Y33R10-2]|uniref:CshA/CshB family fibrillar adhesin-related protein n=1 Tax=Comamonas sp. Y33R10-2 TaxID=2853257 RepID=UPI001C5CAF7B|nr:CshA/CshB family fibrillar adhesin-related protein [Comamonas sp. Y33R10-2]QXZ10875.1 DUF11 domain-containing protein [Comamonas sp. Y33R10-2]
MGRLTLLSWLARILLALQMLWLPQAVLAAAYATGGEGNYKNEILWLTWGGGALGKPDVILADGAKTSASYKVADGQWLEVTCSLKKTSGITLKSYAPGQWKEDRLGALYSVGTYDPTKSYDGRSGNPKPAENPNKLVNGIMVSGQTVQFDVTCTSLLGGRPLMQRGFVIADAEAMSGPEYLQGKGDGEWYLIDKYLDTGAVGSSYLLGGSDSGTAKFSVADGDGKRTAVTFLKFKTPASQQTMGFEMRGGPNGGITAMAIGLVVPYADFGDAPQSYGQAMHVIENLQLNSQNGGAATALTSGSTLNDSLATLAPVHANYLGSVGPDSEPTSTYSPTAAGDDLVGPSNEEDGWPLALKKLSVLQIGGAFSVDVVCQGSGTVAAWVDFNRNNVFDSSERTSATCSGSKAALNWSKVPKDTKSGTSYARLRYASVPSQLEEPTGVADDGEVEDHLIEIIAPKLSLAKSHNAGTAGWTVGQLGAKYLLTVSNRGDIPTGPSMSPDLWKPIKVLDQLPVGIAPDWNAALSINGWSCTYVRQMVTCESPTHLAKAGAAGSQSVIELPVKVVAASPSGTLVNFASVAGGVDPHNGGEPLPPASCTDTNYCANTSVQIKTPAVAVSKTAMPADQSKVKVDDVITYNLQVVVSDAATLSPVVLTDTLGAGLEYQGLSSNAAGFVEGGSGFKRSFTLAKGTVPGTYAVSYRAKVMASAVSKVQNRVLPAGGGDPTDPNAPAPSCVSCATTHSLETPVVTYSKTSNPGLNAEVKAGQNITYTLSVVVQRSQTTQEVVLRDTLGAGLKFGVVVANTGFMVAGQGGTHTFTLPAGAAPGTYLVSYTADVNPAAKSADLTNVVTADNPAGGVPPAGSMPSCTGPCETRHVMSAPRIEYSKTTTAVKAQANDEIEYEVTVKVFDAQTTSEVVLSDTLGADLVFVHPSATGDLTANNAGSNTIVLTLPANKAPGTYKVKYKVRVQAGATTNPLTNAVTATGGGGTPVCVLSCQTATPLVTSEVRYSKSVAVNASPVKVDDVLTFTLKVDVQTAPTLDELTLLDTLGQGLEFEKQQDALPQNWVASYSGQKLTINIPSGLPLGSHEYKYKAKVTKAAAGSVKNAVLGSGADNPSCAINCATETPVAKPVVVIAKTSSSTGAKVGEIIPYTLTATVSDASLTEAVSSMVDNLGQGLEFVAVTSAPGFSYSINGTSLVLTLPKGTAPGTYQVTYDTRVTAAALTSVNNKVEGVPTLDGSTPTCAVSCSVTTPVTREIDAVDDPLLPVKSTSGSTNAGNAYTNDTLNGVPVVPSKITGKVMTPATPINGGGVPVLDVETGIVSVPPGTPAGDYAIVYQICDKLQPTLCDTATITIKVTASPIDAKDDTYTGNRGGGDQVVGNAYSENDTLDGTPFTPERITGTVTTPAQPVGGDPRVPVLDVVTGKVTVPSGTPAGDYRIYYRICEKLNPANCDDAVVAVTVKPDESLLRIVKTASVRTVKIGDLVRYSLQVQNIGAVKVVNANVVDTAANGFTFVNGSMSAVGLGSAVTSSGVRPVQFSGVTLDVGQSGTIVYMMRVGAGVRPGNHVNTAFAKNGVGDSISNQATASVELVSDPLLDDSLIYGTVFDDRDRDGWQDSAKLTGLKAQGGFAPGAYIANSTTVDKGDDAGAVPQADASSPLLHGLTLGSIAARQSEADPVAKHTVVIHQKLQSLDFTDDFVLTSDQGITVRMNAAGLSRIEKTGEAAAGRNAAEIAVERKISQTAQGYAVDYIIQSTGIDERGIPGVRVASVEGLLMETDPFGRYHLAGVNGGRWERGRHFILKVDPSTLPAGAEFTTSNPLLRRVTPGLPVRFDFGVQLNPEFMAGEQKMVEIELGSVLFAAGSSEIRSLYLGEASVIAQVAAKLQQYRGGELLISANGESDAMAFARAEAVRKAVTEKLPAEVQAATKVSVRRDVSDANSIVSGVTANGAVLGSVLFDTDKSVVRPEYQALLAKVAAYLNEQATTQGAAQDASVVSIVGHTDVRASHAYNQKLGLARAKAVYEALLPHLSDALRKRIEVKTEAHTAPVLHFVQKAASH